MTNRSDRPDDATTIAGLDLSLLWVYFGSIMKSKEGLSTQLPDRTGVRIRAAKIEEGWYRLSVGFARELDAQLCEIGRAHV